MGDQTAKNSCKFGYIATNCKLPDALFAKWLAPRGTGIIVIGLYLSFCMQILIPRSFFWPINRLQKSSPFLLKSGVSAAMHLKRVKFVSGWAAWILQRFRNIYIHLPRTANRDFCRCKIRVLRRWWLGQTCLTHDLWKSNFNCHASEKSRVIFII